MTKANPERERPATWSARTSVVFSVTCISSITNCFFCTGQQKTEAAYFSMLWKFLFWKEEEKKQKKNIKEVFQSICAARLPGREQQMYFCFSLWPTGVSLRGRNEWTKGFEHGALRDHVLWHISSNHPAIPDRSNRPPSFKAGPSFSDDLSVVKTSEAQWKVTKTQANYRI